MNYLCWQKSLVHYEGIVSEVNKIKTPVTW